MTESRRAVEAAKVKPGSLLTVEVGGESVVIANVGGKYFAMGGICNHEQWDLSEGTLEGHRITCAGHGSVWDLETGKAEFDEPLYDVRVQDGFLYLKKR